MAPSILSVCIGQGREVPWGTLKRSAIDKNPVSGDIFVHRLGVTGDEQVDRQHHGGVDQAVYAYAREDLDFFGAELGRTLPPGCFGENLTTQGMDVNQSLIGERWRVGTVLFEVSCPRIPCSVFEGFLNEAQWVKRFTAATRPGPYLRVLEEGILRAGSTIEVVHRPAHGVSIQDVFRAKSGEHALVPKLLQAPELPESFSSWARKIPGH